MRSKGGALETPHPLAWDHHTVSSFAAVAVLSPFRKMAPQYIGTHEPRATRFPHPSGRFGVYWEEGGRGYEAGSFMH